MNNKFILFCVFFCCIQSYGQNNFSPTNSYDGHIVIKNGKKLDFKLNFLILLDSTIVGSYYYKPSNGPLKIVGKLNDDYTFVLAERDITDSITGFFKGKLSKDLKSASGKWSNGNQDQFFNFKFNLSEEKAFWDYIKKNRALHEYTNLKKAIKKKHKVLSLDLANQNISSLPEELAALDKIVSINLLGNKFTSFPPILSKLKSLDEISLSSNGLKYLSPEIGKLTNLRILIINFNNLTEIPKEIGKLTNLLYLDIGDNKLDSLPEEIKYLTQLQELHIDDNRLSDNEKKRIKNLLPNCVIYF